MKDFRKLQVWEKAHQLGADALSRHSLISPRRNLWSVVSDSSGGIFNPIEYCRRLWSRGRCRIVSLLYYRQRLGQRTGIPTPTGSRSETHPAQ